METYYAEKAERAEKKRKMAYLTESTREQGGTEIICACGEKLCFAIHWDFTESTCAKCGKRYAIKMGDNFWNCCSGPVNSCLYPPDGKPK